MDIKRFISLFMAVILIFGGVNISHADFLDMPDDWARPGLEHSIEHGLLKGDKNKIRPGDNLTRAELATIASRMLELEEESELGYYSDVKKDDWFYKPMSKAVAAGIFKGSGRKLSPGDPITRQETFTVMYRIFAMDKTEYNLGRFSDGYLVDKWAEDSTSAMVANGYIKGDNKNRINPKSEITRAELATMLMNMVEDFSTEDKSIEDRTIDGNMIINSKVETIKGTTIKGDLILSEGIGDSGLVLDNSKIEGRIIVRSGPKLELKGSEVEDIKILNLSSSYKVDLDENSLIRRVRTNEQVEIRGSGRLEEAIFRDGSEGSLVETSETQVRLDGVKFINDRQGNKINKDGAINVEPENPVGEVDLEDRIELKPILETKNISLLKTGKLEEPVWVEIEENGGKLMELGMTKEDPGYGIIQVQLAQSGNYEIVLKDEKDGRELARIDFIIVEDFKDELVIKAERGLRNIQLVETGYLSRPVWVEIQEDRNLIFEYGLTEDYPGYGVVSLELDRPGGFDILIKDKKDGLLIKNISLTVLPKFKDRIVVKYLDLDKEIELLEDGILDRPVWVELEKDHKIYVLGMTSSSLGYSKIILDELDEPGLYKIKLRDREAGILLGTVELEVEGLSLNDQFEAIKIKLDSLNYSNHEEVRLVLQEARGLLDKDDLDDKSKEVLKGKVANASKNLYEKGENSLIDSLISEIRFSLNENYTMEEIGKDKIKVEAKIQAGIEDHLRYNLGLKASEAVPSVRISILAEEGKELSYNLTIIFDSEYIITRENLEIEIKEVDERFNLYMKKLNDINIETVKEGEMKTLIAEGQELKAELGDNNMASDYLSFNINTLVYKYYTENKSDKNTPKAGLEAKIRKQGKVPNEKNTREIIQEDFKERLGLQIEDNKIDVEIESSGIWPLKKHRLTWSVNLDLPSKLQGEVKF